MKKFIFTSGSIFVGFLAAEMCAFYWRQAYLDARKEKDREERRRDNENKRKRKEPDPSFNEINGRRAVGFSGKVVTNGDI